jgi:hypothetical protein
VAVSSMRLLIAVDSVFAMAAKNLERRSRCKARSSYPTPTRAHVQVRSLTTRNHAKIH